MVAETLTPTIQREFIQNAIKSGIRSDGRAFNDFRGIKITIGPEVGYSQVQLGKTRISANVSCEIVRPSQGSATEGSIIFNTEYSTIASPFFEADNWSQQELKTSRMLEKAFKKSRAVDTEGLCIIAGEKVWAIRVDIRVLDNEGNILDCAGLATMAALMHFKRPDVTVSGVDVVLHSSDEKVPIPLSIHHIPICVTFSFFDAGERHVVDPTLLEEEADEGQMTLVMNSQREVCAITKAGGAIPTDKIIMCSRIAIVKAEHLTKILKDALANANGHSESKRK